jgi:hypothetical protein
MSTAVTNQVAGSHVTDLAELDRLFATLASERAVIRQLTETADALRAHVPPTGSEVVGRLQQVIADLNDVQTAKLTLSQLDPSQVRAGLARCRTILGGGASW